MTLLPYRRFLGPRKAGCSAYPLGLPANARCLKISGNARVRVVADPLVTNGATNDFILWFDPFEQTEIKSEYGFKDLEAKQYLDGAGQKRTKVYTFVIQGTRPACGIVDPQFILD